MSDDLCMLQNNLIGMAYHCFIIICLVLSLCTAISLQSAEFISIDCGSSTLFRDEDEIAWESDDKYVRSGESRSVSANNSLSDVADTLRVFNTSRKKNCYHIDSLKKGRVLLRATFYYGNYDGMDSPPTFSLQFDGNEWTQVETSSREYYYYEVTYVMKKDFISVCLAQTNETHFPFITTIELRSLESYMYDSYDSTYPLFHRKRVAFGSNTTIRYHDDPYDRIWEPAEYGKGSISVSSSARFTDVPSPNDRPPAAILRNAITAITPNGSIDLMMGFASNEMNVYITWYFSEVTLLEAGQNRSFRIFKDNNSFSLPISPPYGDCLQMFVNNTIVSSNTRFSLVPTNVSTLPPLINAMEIFGVGVIQLTDGTNDKDVEGLASLQEGFSVLQSWSGDPCLPSPYTWDWIQCNNDTRPRVTALLLGSYGLSGLIPDFSSMDALQTIDLHNNSIGGPIPDFIGALPNLKTMNVGNNQLNGTLPASLSTKDGLILTVDGNPGLCMSSNNTSCQNNPATTSPPANSASIKNKNKYILELLFAALIPSIIML